MRKRKTSLGWSSDIRNFMAKNNKRNEFFEDLKQALIEGIEHAQGKRNLRTTTLLRPPIAMAKGDVIKLRKKLNVSQAVFANYLNVSVKTVQSWEQGIGKPTGAALKLLSIVRRNPSVLMER